MTREEYILLVEKIVDGSATDAEIALYNESFNTFQYDEETWEQIQLDPVVLEQKSWNQIYGNIQPIEKPAIKLWPRIAVAAAAVAVIVSSVYFYNRQASLKTTRQTAVVNDIAPGKNGATITLANGKEIQLSNAKTGVVVGSDLKYNDGAAVQSGGPNLRQDDGQGDDVMQLTASTAKGQTYQFTLPDGTKVWLNADSKISFPSQFSGKERKILLNGEAYFEVAKLTRKPTKPIDKGTLPREKNGMERVPFMVETDQQIVEVLGTHFNVNSYADEGNTKTTLLEGSVRVLYRAKGPAVPSFYRDDIVLKPNQQSVLTGSGRIAVANVDVSEAVDWKNGEFKFKEETVESIMRKVARWYDVDVIYEKDAPRDITLGGIVSRSRNVSAVLKMMEQTGTVKFKIEGRKIVVGK